MKDETAEKKKEKQMIQKKNKCDDDADLICQLRIVVHHEMKLHRKIEPTLN